MEFSATTLDCEALLRFTSVFQNQCDKSHEVDGQATRMDVNIMIAHACLSIPKSLETSAVGFSESEAICDLVGVEMCLVFSVVQRFENWRHETPGVDNAKKITFSFLWFFLPLGTSTKLGTTMEGICEIWHKGGFELIELIHSDSIYILTISSQLDMRDASHCNTRPTHEARAKTIETTRVLPDLPTALVPHAKTDCNTERGKSDWGGTSGKR